MAVGDAEVKVRVHRRTRVNIDGHPETGSTMAKRSKRGKGKFELYRDDHNLVMRYAGGAIRHYTRPRCNSKWRYESERIGLPETITIKEWVEKPLLRYKQDATAGQSGPLRTRELSNRKTGAKPHHHSRGRKELQSRTIILNHTGTKRYTKFMGVPGTERY